MDIRAGILGTAQRLGMNPVDLATIISYETAGTFDPAKRGPTTQWGQHRGLIQFGEPQAKQYGVNWDDPVGSQLGPGGAVEKYFLDRGWKPGMGRLDAYSIVNAGGPGLYNRSDANNGGAPGTVADKVRNQMAGHEAKARALLGGDIADDTMRALGRQPMAQQTMQMSTKSGPMGLLGSVQPEEPGGLLGLLGRKPAWASKANDIGAVLLALSGSPAAGPLMEMSQARKKDKREADRINQTVQWLSANGRTDLAEAVAAGTLSGSDAAKVLLTPADPMAPLQIQSAQLDLEKKQFELQKLQDGASSDPNVQSSASLPDQSGVVLTMRDGNVVVKTVGGDTLTGQGAVDYVRKSQETAADLQRGIYGARREGTLGADVAFGEPAAAASARGAEIGKAQGAAITGESGAVAKAQDAIDLIDDILNDPALPSITGMIQGRLPPLSQEGTNLDVKIRQLKGKAFLEAFESLKGGGAITEAEGRAATEAMARLDRAQDDTAYAQSLNELQAIMRRGQKRAQLAAERASGGTPNAPTRRKFNPQTGALE